MRLSSRLLSNAATTYMSMGTTLVLGLFTTWYIVGAAGVAGFGLLALASSSTGITRALELAIRMGLIRELASAIASGDPERIRKSLTAARHLCSRMMIPLSLIITSLAAAAGLGFFNTPGDQPELTKALMALIIGEGIHGGARLMGAPFMQSLFASQRVGLDNLLVVVSRLSYALSAVLVFGLIVPSATVATQLMVYAVSRVTLQLVDVIAGVWLAKRLIPHLELDSAVDREEYLTVRSTVWHSSQVEVLLNLCPQFIAIAINLVFGLTFNGIWQIVVQLSGYARLFSEGLLRGIAPLTAHLQSDGKTAHLRSLMTKSVRYQLTFAIPAALFIGIFAEPILALWVGNRLAGDPHLASAGISTSQALIMASEMTVVMLAVRALRSAGFGIERILYGIGKVTSYSWFSKWAVLLAVFLSTALMVKTGDPRGAPVGLLVAYAIYSPGVVLFAARRETGLPVVTVMRRSVPGPFLANMFFFLFLVAVRQKLDRISLAELLLMGAVSGLLYGVIAFALALEQEERKRLLEIGRSLLRRVRFLA